MSKENPMNEVLSDQYLLRKNQIYLFGVSIRQCGCYGDPGVYGVPRHLQGHQKRNQADHLLRSASQREVFRSICQFQGYENSCVKKPAARILESAFGLGIIQRNVYDQIFAKVAFSQLLSTEDKKKLLLNKRKDVIVSLSEIPFDTTRDKQLSFDKEKASLLPLNREQALHKLLCSMHPAVDALLNYGLIYCVKSL